MAITSYDVSPDGNDLVFAAIEADKETKIWYTRTDRREPPRQIAQMQAFGPVFGGARTVYFRGVEGSASYVFRTDLQTGQTVKFRPEPVVNSPAVSPDRKWVVVSAPFESRGSVEPTRAFPVDGGNPIALCAQCFVSWSRDANTVYFTVAEAMGSTKSLAVPLPKGQAFPKLPPQGFVTLKEGEALPGARVLDHPMVYPGTSRGTYAYVMQTAHRNLYRVTLPR